MNKDGDDGIDVRVWCRLVDQEPRQTSDQEPGQTSEQEQTSAGDAPTGISNRSTGCEARLVASPTTSGLESWYWTFELSHTDGHGSADQNHGGKGRWIDVMICDGRSAARARFEDWYAKGRYALWLTSFVAHS